MKVYICNLHSNHEKELNRIFSKQDINVRYFSENRLINIDRTYDLYIINVEKNIIDLFKFYKENEELLKKTIFISGVDIQGKKLCNIYNWDREKSQIHSCIESLINNYQGDSTLVTSKVIVKGKRSIHFINPDEILFVEKVDREIVIHKKDERIRTKNTLSEISRKLPEYFINLHKSFIVNLDEISNIVEVGDRTYEIRFEGTDSKALMSRYKAEKLFSMLNI